MKISVIMVDGNFRERFHLIDFLNTQTMPLEDYEIIWVEFYGKAKEELRLKKNVKIVILGNIQETEYHSSRCFNEGIRRSRGEITVIPDADIVVEPTFLETIYKEHLKCEKLVMYFRRWDESREIHDKKASYKLQYLRKNCRHTNPGNYGGCLTVRKKWLLEINGYEEDHAFSSGFHANGLDVYTRLCNLGLHIMWNPSEKIYHPWHPQTLVASQRYDAQHSITRKRQYNLSYLCNYGIDASKNKSEKDVAEVVGKEREGVVRKLKRFVATRLKK